MMVQDPYAFEFVTNKIDEPARRSRIGSVTTKKESPLAKETYSLGQENNPCLN